MSCHITVDIKLDRPGRLDPGPMEFDVYANETTPLSIDPSSDLYYVVEGVNKNGQYVKYWLPKRMTVIALE